MLEKIIENMNGETATFIVIITICAAIFHVRFTHANANKAPAILTTFGILGTFFGIALGLLDFNPNDIQTSVPMLIDGIKTAFWVSAWGIFCALTIKVREAFWGVPKISSDDKYQGATVDDLASLLQDVKSALVGSEESTLLGQIKLARQDSNDRIDNLKKSFDDFAVKVAENNSKALIEALREVIRDFNTKISEQFGDNFKQLNQAVGKTLEWQEQYRHQVAEMIEQQTQASKNMAVTAESMALATDRYKSIVEQAASFNEIAQALSELLKASSENVTALEMQRHQVDESLRSLATLINTASSGLPEIEGKITAITEQLGRSVKETGEEFNNALLSNIRNSTQEISNDVKQVTKQLSDGVTASNDEFKKLLLNTIQQTNQEFNANLQQVNQEINGNVKQLVEKTKEQVRVLDAALSEELTKSLESLGSQLVSLSQKFAEDYTPLTNKLRDILEIARKAA